MKRLLRALLLIVVLIGVAYFLLIDHALKAAIEAQGSKALLARLDVGSVTFHLVPTSIRLEHVQVTNPQQPARNLLEFDALSTPLQLSALRDRKLDIPELQVRGLRFDTARASTGAIPGLTPLGTSGEVLAEMPDSTQVALQQQQRLQDEVNETRQDLAATLAKWRAQLQQLPDEARIAEYGQRVAALRAANKTAELAQLRQQMDGELAKARQLRDDFELDMQSARAQLAYAQSAPGSTGGTGATPQAMNGVVGALLGSQFEPALAAISARLDGLVRQAQAGQPTDFAVLARRAAIDGQIDVGGQPLLFTGTIDNLTPQPRQWDVATRFELAGVPEQPSRFSARGQIDLRKTPRIDARFDLREFQVRNFPLSANPQLTLAVESANVDIQGMLSATGNQLDVNLLGRFQHPRLAVQATTDSATQALRNALQGNDDFDMNLQLSGSMQKPTVKFDSSLTPRLAAALSQQLQSGTALSPDLQRQLGGVQQLANDFENLRQQLLARQAALQDIAAPR